MLKEKIAIDDVDYTIIEKAPIDGDWHQIYGIEVKDAYVLVKAIPIMGDKEIVEIHISGGGINFQQPCQKEIPCDFWMEENNCFYVMATRNNRILILKNLLAIQERSFVQSGEKQTSTK